MASPKVPPLNQNNPIVDAKGQPRPFFVLLVNQLLSSSAANAIAIAQAAQATADAAQATANAAAAAAAALDVRVDDLEAVNVIAGVGLDGGGLLGDGNVTLDLSDTSVTPGTYGDATHSPQLTVDQQGRVTSVVDVPIAGGGGGGGDWWFDPPLAADFPTIVSVNAPSVPTVTDDADIGMTISWAGVTANNDGAQGCYKALPSGVDWTLETYYTHQAPQENYRYGGLSVRVAGTGKSYTFALMAYNGNFPYLFTLGQTGLTGQGINTIIWYGLKGTTTFMKLAWTQSTSTLTVYVSVDGKNWTRVYEQLSSAFLGAAPDQVGFKIHAAVGGGQTSGQFAVCGRWVQSW